MSCCRTFLRLAYACKASKSLQRTNLTSLNFVNFFCCFSNGCTACSLIFLQSLNTIVSRFEHWARGHNERTLLKSVCSISMRSSVQATLDNAARSFVGSTLTTLLHVRERNCF